MATFTSLYSGSSGNSALIRSETDALLIDMGKNCKQTLLGLQQAGAQPSDLRGILITHEHSDHVSGLKVFLKKYKVPVYASAKTLDALAEYDLVPADARLMELEGKQDVLGLFEVESFPTSHDAADCHGYRICTPQGGTLAMATDLGCVTPAAFAGLQYADLVVLEANYDANRLRTGPYPYYLKTRIASARGHLCNTDTGTTLAALLKKGCERFALCHLSNENNTPELALTAVQNAFLEAGSLPGADSLLTALSRHSVSPTIHF